MTPIVSTITSDCRENIFRYLTFYECLQVSEVSKFFLEQITAEVERRRRHQFLIRPCEELTCSGDTILNLSMSVRQSELPPGDELLVNDDDKTKNPFLHRAMDHEEDDMREATDGKQCSRSWYSLPSVAERLDCLYRSIPHTHPFNDDLRNLVLDLKESKTVENFGGTKDNFNDQSHDIFQKFSSITYAHRLHASLLSRCTVNLNPDPYDRHGVNNIHSENGDSESFTVTLERYMGDVLSARCLIGHSNYFGSIKNHINSNGDGDVTMTDSNDGEYENRCQVAVQGGPSFDQWIDHLVSFKENSANVNSNDSGTRNKNSFRREEITLTKYWYQYWVFFHSALLRVSPFTLEQAKQLRLEPFSGILEPYDLNNSVHNQSVPNNDNGNSTSGNANISGGQQLHSWFLPSRTYSCFSPECQDVKLLSEHMNQLFRDNNQRIAALETTLNHFGPLGPAFRGRDRVSTEVMLPHKLYVSVLRNSLLSWTLNNKRLQSYMGMNREYVNDLRRWLSDSDNRGVMRWMKLLQDQSTKTRPMTVQPPLVTIRMVTLSGMETNLAEVNAQN